MNKAGIALVILIGATSAAVAQGNTSMCQGYAANAAGMADLAIKKNPACLDYSKGVHGNFQMHFDWCMKNPAPSVQGAEDNIRRLVTACTQNAAAPAPMPAPMPSSPAVAPPATWAWCSKEKEMCNPPYPTTIRYGARGAFKFKAMNGPFFCGNQEFGDPIVGVGKTCEYQVKGNAAAAPRAPAPSPMPSGSPPPSGSTVMNKYVGTPVTRMGDFQLLRFYDTTNGAFQSCSARITSGGREVHFYQHAGDSFGLYFKGPQNLRGEVVSIAVPQAGSVSTDAIWLGGDWYKAALDGQVLNALRRNPEFMEFQFANTKTTYMLSRQFMPDVFTAIHNCRLRG